MELTNSKAFSGVCYFLASVFVITGILTLWSFRLLPGPITSLTRQRSIHICAILVALCRSVFFFLVPSWEGIMFYIRMSPSPDTTSIMLYVLEDIPSLIFILLFSLQLLSWGHSYYTAISAVHIYHAKMRPIVRNCIWLLVALQLFIWISYSVTVGPKTKYHLDPDIWSLSAAVLHSVAFLIGAIIMLIYGRLVQRNISQVPVALEVRNRQLRRIALVTSVCTITFLVRTIGIVVASVMAYVDIGEFTDNSSFFALCFAMLFFLTTELLPLGVLLHFQGEFRRVRFQRNRLDIIPQFSKNLFANLQKGATYATFATTSRHRIVYSKEPESIFTRISNFLFRRTPRGKSPDPEQQPLVTASTQSYGNWQTFAQASQPSASISGTAPAASTSPAPILPSVHPAVSTFPHIVQPTEPKDQHSPAKDSAGSATVSPGAAPPIRASRRPIASATSQQLRQAPLSSDSAGSAHIQQTLRGPAPELVPGTPLFAHAIELGAASSEWVDPSMSPAHSFRLSSLLKQAKSKGSATVFSLDDPGSEDALSEHNIGRKANRIRINGIEDDISRIAEDSVESADVTDETGREGSLPSASPSSSSNSSYCTSPSPSPEDNGIFDFN